jgi:tetratricopeptide (TPR) repeat protein
VPKPGLFASPGQRNLVLGLLLVVAALALYNPVSQHPFVSDDDRYITDNVHVHAGLRWDTIKWAFTSYDEANWHPLTWLSHALDYQLFGLNPAGHHYMNVLLHALNAVLLFWVLWWTTEAAGRSWMVAALFALQPINVESVAWVAERKNILSFLFFLLALAAYGHYAKKPSAGRYLQVMTLFACGLMAKPMIITFPFVLLLWDYWPLKRMDSETGRARSFPWLVIEKLPLMVLSAASAILTLKAQKAGEAIRSVAQYSVSIRLENAVVSYVRYVGKLFWPSRLSPIYPHPGHFLAARQVIGAGLLLLLGTGLVFAARRRRYLLVGWFWFLGTLVPMIGLVQVGNQAMADRYAYLPFVGLFILVCWGGTDWATAQRMSMPWLAAVGAICVLGLAIVAYRQIGFWKDNVSLWAHAIEVTPPNFIAEDNLGGALIEADRPDEAMTHFRRATAIEPSDPMSRLNLAADEQRHGNIPQAIVQFAEVIESTDDVRLRAIAFTDLGYCYRKMGDRIRAKQSFQAATSLRPGTFRAWVGLGLVAHDSGDESEAIRDYVRSLSIQPWDLTYFLLARALEKDGRIKESQAASQEAKRLSANFNQLQQVGDELLAK